MRILITGISGFIGGSLGRYALDSGHVVLGTGRSRVASPNWTGKYLPTDGSEESLGEIIRDFAPDVLLHAAGTASVRASLESPLSDFRGAALILANTLEAVRRSDRKTLVVIPSSAAVYGNPASLPVAETAPVQPISPYGFHKAVCELLAREYAECFDLNILVCRLFSVFGAFQHRLLVWELFQQLAGEASIVWLDGTGSESRDFLCVDDLAPAVLQLVMGVIDESSAGRFEIINIGSGEETRVIGLASQMRDLVAPEKEVRCRGISRPGDPLRWCADISKLRRLAPSWHARSLVETLAECFVAWQQEAVLFEQNA